MTRVTYEGSIVVRGRSRRGAFPAAPAEVGHDVILDGTESPFDVLGGIYGKNVKGIGPGIARGPVLASGRIDLEGQAGSTLRFHEGLSAYRAIRARVATEGPSGPEATLAGRLDGLRFVIRGDVRSAERVELENALVIGSVIAPAVRLEGSIVLGQVQAQGTPGELHAVNSTLGVFDVARLILEGRTSITVAGGACDERPELRDHMADDGTSYTSAIRLLPLCRQKTLGCGLPNSPLRHVDASGDGFEHAPGVCCEYWVKNACPFTTGVSMTAGDFVLLSPTAPAESGVGQAASSPPADRAADVGPRERWYFGLHRRALNLQLLEESSAVFNEALHRLFAFDHLGEAARHELWELLESKKLSMQETELLRLALEDS